MSYGKVFNLLKENNIKNWLLYTKHEFVNKLSLDILKEESFFNYLIQDYLFLIQFSKAWSLAVLKADNLEEMKIAAFTVNNLINFEMELHISLCENYGISKLDLENSNEKNENIAYTRYVLELGYSGDFLDLLSSLAPCVLGYGEIGHNNRNAKPNTFMYKKWIETYSSKEYQDVCKNVANLIDKAFTLRLGKEYTSSYKWKKVNKIFKKATLLEIGFWDMALKDNVNV
jgi:thiaminase (transcriptional activator TenA)